MHQKGGGGGEEGLLQKPTSKQGLIREGGRGLIELLRYLKYIDDA